MKGEKGKAPAFQFYIKDWLTDPQLRLTSASTRGIWIDLLCWMWANGDKGVLNIDSDKISRLTGATLSEVALFIDEAVAFKFCDIIVEKKRSSEACHSMSQKSHSMSQQCHIKNRRMYRERNARESARLRKQKQRSQQMSHDGHSNVQRQKGGAPSPTPTPTAINNPPNPPSGARIFTERKITDWRIEALNSKPGGNDK